VQLPIALNIVRVITFPLGRVFGAKLEKLLNMTFLVLIINSFLSAMVLIFCTLFYVVAVGATCAAGLLMVAMSEKDATETPLSLGSSVVGSTLSSAKKRGCIDRINRRSCAWFKFSVQVLEFLVITPCFVVLQSMCVCERSELKQQGAAASAGDLFARATAAVVIPNSPPPHL
jgi:hypothetical protein